MWLFDQYLFLYLWNHNSNQEIVSNARIEYVQMPRNSFQAETPDDAKVHNWSYDPNTC